MEGAASTWITIGLMEIISGKTKEGMRASEGSYGSLSGRLSRTGGRGIVSQRHSRCITGASVPERRLHLTFKVNAA